MASVSQEGIVLKYCLHHTVQNPAVLTVVLKAENKKLTFIGESTADPVAF